MYRTHIDPLKLFGHLQRAGMSQNQLAKRAKVSVSTVSCIMKGKHCTQRVGKAICEALDIDPDDLLEIVTVE